MVQPTNTDSILWYSVPGVFADQGYAVPNPGDDPATMNPTIADLVSLMGKNVYSIMHHHDANMTRPPSVMTLERIHKLYVRAVQVLAGRMVGDGERKLEPQHVTPALRVFRVYPCPFFLVRSPYMQRWCEWMFYAISEAMQHTENREPFEISERFAGTVGQYIKRVYDNMAVEMFGKTKEQVKSPEFRLVDADFRGYDPDSYFTSTEMDDTVSPLGQVLTEDQRKVLTAGILVTDLPQLQPWPLNLSEYYRRQESGDNTAAERSLGDSLASGTTSAGSADPSSVPTIPAPPGP
jgi:hypothetical protein